MCFAPPYRSLRVLRRPARCLLAAPEQEVAPPGPPGEGKPSPRCRRSGTPLPTVSSRKGELIPWRFAVLHTVLAIAQCHHFDGPKV